MPPGYKSEPSSSSSKPAPPSAPEPVSEPEPEPMQVEEVDQSKQTALDLKKEGTEFYKKREFAQAAEKFEKAWEEWQGDVSFLTNLSGECEMSLLDA